MGTSVEQVTPLGDAGSGWIPDQRVDSNSTDSRNPKIGAGPDSALHAVWQQPMGGNNWSIFYSSSADGGVTWRVPIAIEGPVYSGFAQSDPDVAVAPSDGRIYVAYTRNARQGALTGPTVTYLASSSDGIKWSLGQVSPTPGLNQKFLNATVAIQFDVAQGSGYSVYVAYQNITTIPLRGIFKTVGVAIVDSGGGVRANACNICGNRVEYGPDLAYQRNDSGTDKLLLAWVAGVDVGTGVIQFTSSLDAISWTGLTNISGTERSPQSPTIIAARDGSTIEIGWQSIEPPNPDVCPDCYFVRYSYYPFLRFGRPFWSPPASLGFDTGDNIGPTLTADGEGTNDATVAGSYHFDWTGPNDVLVYASTSVHAPAGWTFGAVSDAGSRASAAYPSKGISVQGRGGSWYPVAVWSDSRTGSNAVFATTPGSRVVVATSPSNLSFAVDGTNYTATTTLPWPAGLSHLLETTSPQRDVSGVKWLWVSWSDGGNRSHLVTATTTDASYVANFAAALPTVVITSPTNGTEIKANPLRVEGRSTNATRIEVHVGPGTPNIAIGLSPWTADLSIGSLPNGTYLITATAWNGAAASSSAQVNITLAIFHSAPTVTITSPKDGASIATRNLLVQGTSTNATRVDVRVANGNWAIASGTSEWSLVLVLADLPNGSYVIEARALNATTTLSSVTGQVRFQLAIPGEIPGEKLCVSCAAGGTLAGVAIAVSLQEVARRRDGSKRKQEPPAGSRGSITYWNRLEPRPRSERTVSEGLAARIRDPLWMLARQWQFGEFHGEDAGSPAFVQVVAKLAAFEAWSSNGESSLSLDKGVPMEQVVESESFTPDFAIRVELGQTFESLLGEAGKFGLVSRFRDAYPIPSPGSGVAGRADSDTDRFLSVCAGRAIDGYELYRAALASAPGLPPTPSIGPTDAPAIQRALEEFVGCVGEVFGSLGTIDSPAWTPERMEYALRVLAKEAAGDPTELLAHPGRDADFDWYAFDLFAAETPSLGQTGITARRSESRLTSGTGKLTGGRSKANLEASPASPESAVRRSVFPAPVRFKGMPNPRWWDFEDSTIDFGAITPEKRDLGKLVFMDFMLLYSNDWFVAPFDQPVGSLCAIESLAVHDVFGKTTDVQRADAVPAPKGDRWTMFSTSLADDSSGVADFFVLPPSAGTALQRGRILEEVVFLRDEVANIAWGIEKTTENGIGDPRPGHERSLAASSSEGAESKPTSGSDPSAPVLHYRLQTAVPENWIPFLPVALDSVKGTIGLQRGRVLASDGGQVSTEPAGRILRPSSDQGKLFVVREEEIPRSGLRVVRSVQLARWLDGSTHLWISRRKTSGRGKGASGLRFDVATLE